MKHFIIIATALCLVHTAQSQTYEMTPSGGSSELTVSIENLYAYINVEGSNDGKISIESEGFRGLPEKAKGLKPLSATGPDNTDIGLNVQQEGNVVTISGANRSADDAEYKISLPKGVKLKIEYNSFHADDVRVANMANEVEIESKTGDIDLVDVTGPIVANSLSSDISVIFTSISQSSPTSIASTSGDIDVTLPADTKGNFKMKSVSGEVYTDLDFDVNEESNLRRYGGGMNANATLNGGGVQISLRVISGDIYLRKK